MTPTLARALRLNEDETDHLYRLAGRAVPDRGGCATHVRPALMFVLDQMREAAAFVCSDTGVVLAQNEYARVLMGDRVADPGVGPDASISYQWFTDAQVRDVVPEQERDLAGRTIVADLRAAWARRRSDTDMAELVDTLLRQSSEFAELWARHEVAVRRMQRKTFLTAVGPITLDCEVLSTEDSQRLVVLTPPPGSTALADLRLLSVVRQV